MEQHSQGSLSSQYRQLIPRKKILSQTRVSNHPPDTTGNSRVEAEVPQNGSYISLEGTPSAIQPKTNAKTKYYPITEVDFTAPKMVRTRSIWGVFHPDWWLKEILCLILSLSAFLGIVVLLNTFHNRPLPNLPYNVTLNSYLSLLTVVANAALLVPVAESIGQLKWIWFVKEERPLGDFQTYDEASRGLLGAFKLIGKFQGRNLASIGALVSILCVAIGPLTQQVIAYPTHLVPSGKNANAKAQKSWFYYDSVSFGDHMDVTQPIKHSVLNGMFSSPNTSVPMLEPTCSTGNCSWPEYSSLSVCTLVSNVTEWLFISDRLNPNVSYMLPPVVIASLPNGVEQKMGDVSQALLTPKYFDGSSSLVFNNLPNISDYSILNFFIIYQHKYYVGNDWANVTVAYRAAEVMFHWCVNTYSTEVVYGKATTNITASSHQVLSTTGILDLKNNLTLVEENLILQGNNDSTNYTIDRDSQQGIQAYFKDSWSGNYSIGSFKYQGAHLYRAEGGPSTNGALSIFTAMQLEAGKGSDGADTSNGTLAELEKYGFEGIGNVTRNVATSVTNAIRSRPFRGDPVEGIAFIPQTFVQVRWPWLSYLAVLEVLCIVFLTLTIFKSDRAKVGILKSSPLAAMCALSHAGQTHMGGIETQGDAWKRAKGLKVILEKGGSGGWTLERKAV